MCQQNPSISLLIHDLRCGGAELVASVLACGLHDRGYEISIITLRGLEEPFYPLHDDVRVAPLNVASEDRSLPGRIHKTRRAVRALRRALDRLNPDVLVGFMTEANVLSVLSARIVSRQTCPIIATEHVDPAMTRSSYLARAARLATLPLADAIVPVSEALAPWYRRWCPARKVRVIPNPVVLEDRGHDPRAEKQARQMDEDQWLVAMGRLHRQKGFDLLLDSFSRLSPTARSNWKLGILGDGPLHDDLQAQIDREGPDDRILLLGRFSNPYPILRAADLFCLSSRYEGFGIALAEAMACGLPAVSFDCPTGPAEIIRNGVDGVLVPPGDVDSLARALQRLMTHHQQRREMARRAPEVRERFGLEKFLDRWETLIRRVSGGLTRRDY